MELGKMAALTPKERQANIDKLVTAWKMRRKQMEETSQQQVATAPYQAALEELEKRRLLRGSPTVEV